jgi:hypothetical protein
MCPHGNSVYERCATCDKVRATQERVEAAFKVVSDAINGGYGDAKDMLANLVANEHPTLSGQFAKAVALGIMRRSVRDETFRPFDSWDRDCQLYPMSAENPPHPDHDGRHSCKLVIGSMLAAQQFYV